VSISFIVPTIGRASLAQTLASIKLRSGDEILLVGERATGAFSGTDWRRRFIPCLPGNDWGSTERNLAMPYAHGQYLAFMDDDDTYAPGYRALMQDAIDTTPDRPVIFRQQYPDGRTLWQEPVVMFGNVGTPMFLIPNVPEKLGVWGSFVGGDCYFLEQCGWLRSEFVWRPEVVALIGDNVPSHAKGLVSA
jgi:glycosyltransferase involved in cell wall biosynthesis